MLIFFSFRSGTNENTDVHIVCDVNFARDPLRSYFHEPQKNEIHLLYLHFVFTSFWFIISVILI